MNRALRIAGTVVALLLLAGCDKPSGTVVAMAHDPAQYPTTYPCLNSKGKVATCTSGTFQAECWRLQLDTGSHACVTPEEYGRIKVGDYFDGRDQG